MEPLRRQLASCLTQGSRLPRLVAFCNTGARSGAASVLLSKTLSVAVSAPELLGAQPEAAPAGPSGEAHRRMSCPVAPARACALQVRSLCGGIIAYYNQGGRVRDPSGSEVQAIHPGSSDLRQYVTRPSNFKFST